MTAAFALEPTGPPVSCDYPGCLLESFHDGDHEFAPKKPRFTADRIHKCEVCGNRFVIFGEHQEPSFPSERKTCGDPNCILEFARRESAKVEFPLMCRCAQRPYAHSIEIHTQLRSESYDPKLKHKWPWSLCLSPRVEPSTERNLG